VHHDGFISKKHYLHGFVKNLLYGTSYNVGIIGYVPMGAREQRLETSKVPKGIECEEIQVDSKKGITLRGILVRRSGNPGSTTSPQELKTIMFYMQGIHLAHCNRFKYTDWIKQEMRVLP
jgi:hypothetical protein